MKKKKVVIKAPKVPKVAEATPFQRDVLWRLDYLVRKVTKLSRMEGRQMAALDDLKREVEETKSVQASAIALLAGLKEALDAAIASGDPAALTALAADLDAAQTTLADAIVANTPAAKTIK